MPQRKGTVPLQPKGIAPSWLTLQGPQATYSWVSLRKTQILPPSVFFSIVLLTLHDQVNLGSLGVMLCLH